MRASIASADGAASDAPIFPLDGPGAVRHVDALLEGEELDAIQWVPGARIDRKALLAWPAD